MNRREQAIQKTVMEHVERRLVRDVFVTHIPLGGKRNPIEAAIMKGLGTVPGVPDLMAIKAGQSYFLELKSEDGKLTTVQAECQERLRQAGAVVGTVWGLDEALAWLEKHGILRGTASLRTVGLQLCRPKSLSSRKAAQPGVA